MKSDIHGDEEYCVKLNRIVSMVASFQSQQNLCVAMNSPLRGTTTEYYILYSGT